MPPAAILGGWQSSFPFAVFSGCPLRPLPVFVLLALGLSVLFCVVAPARATDRGNADLYRRVLAQARDGHFTVARRLAVRAHSVELDRLLSWMDYTSDSPTGTFAQITAFITAGPDWPWQARLEAAAEEAITGSTPDKALVAWFRHRSPITMVGAVAYAKALLATGHTKQGVAMVRRIWIRYNFSPLRERVFLDKFGRYLKPGDNWRRLDRLLWDQRITAARRMLLRVDAAHRLLAQARIALEVDRVNPSMAVARVPAALKSDPGLIFDRIRWRRLNGYDDQAMDLMLRVHAAPRRPGLWWAERSILAREALKDGLARRAYEVAADNGLSPRSADQPAAEFLAGWIALDYLDKPKLAAPHFLRLWRITRTPISKARAAYWSGRAAEALGDRKAARLWYDRAARFVTTFYGQLAASQIGERHLPLPRAPRVTAADRHWLDNRALIGVVRLLRMARQEELMRPFLIALDTSATTPGEHVLVARLADEMGRRDVAVLIARRASMRGQIMIRAGWPLPRLSLRRKPARALVLALIRQESSFHSAARSPAGARGLMQLLPATARRMAHLIRVAFSQRRLDDPDFNVRLGSVYLERLVSEFHGSYVLALAAYNAGPTRVRRWVKKFGNPGDPDVDAVDWIERIPFGETRNYVQRVMESVEIYRRRLGEKGGSDLAADLKR